MTSVIIHGFLVFFFFRWRCWVQSNMSATCSNLICNSSVFQLCKELTNLNNRSKYLWLYFRYTIVNCIFYIFKLVNYFPPCKRRFNSPIDFSIPLRGVTWTEQKGRMPTTLFLGAQILHSRKLGSRRTTKIMY